MNRRKKSLVPLLLLVMALALAAGACVHRSHRGGGFVHGYHHQGVHHGRGRHHGGHHGDVCPYR